VEEEEDEEWWEVAEDEDEEEEGEESDSGCGEEIMEWSGEYRNFLLPSL
jgi:hypothetical protein